MTTVMFFDFARCTCGHLTAIRPSKILTPNVNQQPIDTDEDPVIVACIECKCVAEFEIDDLQSYPTPQGYGPYNPDAPTRVFQVPIKCDDLHCDSQRLTHVVLNANTSDEELLVEQKKWRWKEGDLTCERSGHVIPYPRWE